jgi:hypothetical protein
MYRLIFRSFVPLFSASILILVAGQGCQPGSDCSALQQGGVAAAIPEPVQERYVLTVIRSVTGPTLVRTDTATCRMWRMRLNTDVWVAISPETRAPGEGLPAKAGRYMVSNVRSKYGPMMLCNDVEKGLVYHMPMDGEGGWKQVKEPANDMSKLDRIPLSRVTIESEPPATPKVTPAPGAGDDARSLGIGDEASIMRETVEDKDLPATMRVFAAEQLGKIKSEETLPTLVEALEDSDPAVVVAAIWALKINGDPQAIPALEKLASHEDDEVRSASDQVIEALSQ